MFTIIDIAESDRDYQELISEWPVGIITVVLGRD